MKKMNGMKVFSATKARERDMLGETITEWIAANPEIEILDQVITQSSDSEFHCLTITLLLHDPNPARRLRAFHASQSGALSARQHA